MFRIFLATIVLGMGILGALAVRWVSTPTEAQIALAAVAAVDSDAADTVSTAAEDDANEPVARCEARWSELGSHIGFRTAGQVVGQVVIAAPLDALETVERLRDDRACNARIAAVTDGEPERVPLLSACPSGVLTGLRAVADATGATTASDRNFRAGRASETLDSARYLELKECYAALTDYAIRARVAALGGADAASAAAAEDVVSAFYVRALSPAIPPSPERLLPYVKRLVELEPRDVSTHQLLAKLAYARWSLASDPTEKERAAGELLDVLRRTKQAGVTSIYYESALRAGVARLADPTGGLTAFVRGEPMLHDEEKMYYLAWAKHAAGDDDSALRYLRTILGAPVEDLAPLAEVAIHRLGAPRTGETAFLDPWITVGYGLEVASGAEARIGVADRRTRIGRLAPGAIEREENVPDSIHERIRNGLTENMKEPADSRIARHERMSAALKEQSFPRRDLTSVKPDAYGSFRASLRAKEAGAR